MTSDTHQRRLRRLGERLMADMRSVESARTSWTVPRSDRQAPAGDADQVADVIDLAAWRQDTTKDQ